MAKYKDEQLRRGAEALRDHIQALLDENRELGDFHQAFEFCGSRKFIHGTSASTLRLGGKNQKGGRRSSTRNAITSWKRPGSSDKFVGSKPHERRRGPVSEKPILSSRSAPAVRVAWHADFV
jgi:hypothetical protein